MTHGGSSASDADFCAFYRATAPRMLACARHLWPNREEAEDAVHEAYTRLYSRWDRISTFECPEGWVYMVMSRLLRRARRRWIRAQTVTLAPTTPTYADVVETVSVREVLHAVARLPFRQRQVIVLCCVQDLPQHEVARMLGVSRGSVGASLHKARVKLAKELGLASDGHDGGVALLPGPQAQHGATVDQVTFALRDAARQMETAYAADEEGQERALAAIRDSARGGNGKGSCG